MPTRILAFSLSNTLLCDFGLSPCIIIRLHLEAMDSERYALNK